MLLRDRVIIPVFAIGSFDILFNIHIHIAFGKKKKKIYSIIITFIFDSVESENDPTSETDGEGG